MLSLANLPLRNMHYISYEKPIPTKSAQQTYVMSNGLEGSNVSSSQEGQFLPGQESYTFCETSKRGIQPHL